jgi:hypothetical protein
MGDDEHAHLLLPMLVRGGLARRNHLQPEPKLSAIPHEIQLIADEALALAAFDTPMAPTRIRLNAQTTSRLNQLFEMNLNPSHS